MKKLLALLFGTLLLTSAFAQGNRESFNERLGSKPVVEASVYEMDDCDIQMEFGNLFVFRGDTTKFSLDTYDEYDSEGEYVEEISGVGRNGESVVFTVFYSGRDYKRMNHMIFLKDDQELFVSFVE